MLNQHGSRTFYLDPCLYFQISLSGTDTLHQMFGVVDCQEGRIFFMTSFKIIIITKIPNRLSLIQRHSPIIGISV